MVLTSSVAWWRIACGHDRCEQGGAIGSGQRRGVTSDRYRQRRERLRSQVCVCVCIRVCAIWRVQPSVFESVVIVVTIPASPPMLLRCWQKLKQRGADPSPPPCLASDRRR